MPIIGPRLPPELLFPRWPFRLRRDHPLAQGLLAAFVPAPGGLGMIDVANGRVGKPVNAGGDLTNEYLPGLDILTPRFSGDATADRVDLGSVSGDDPFAFAGATELTILTWLRRTGANGQFGRILDKSSSGNATGGYAIYVDNTDYHLIFQTDGSASSFHDSTYIPALNDTVLIGYTMRSLSQGDFYADGVFIDRSARTLQNIPGSTTNAAIGNWNHSTNRMFPGFIGPTMVYNRALSDAEHAEAFDPATRWGMFAPPRQFWFVPAASETVDMAGTIAASSATTASASLARSVAGASPAVSATTASASVVRPVSAALAASSDAMASVSRARTVAGSSDAVSDASAAASVARGVAGASSADSAVTGVISRLRGIAGTAASASATSGALARLRGLASTSAAVSALTGSLSTAAGTALAGIASATSALSGSLSRAAGVAGSSTSSSAASGSLARARVVAGQIAAASVSTASAAVARAIGGGSAALSTLSGTLTKVSEAILSPAVTIQALLQTRASISGSYQATQAIGGAMIATARIVAYIPSVDGARRMSIENRLLRLYNASQITLAATVRDADGEAVDITGWSFDWKLVAAADREAVETPADVSLSTGGGEIVITDATAGEVEVRIPNGSFDGMSGNHRWQLIGTDGQSREWVVSTGPMHFWPTL